MEDKIKIIKSEEELLDLIKGDLISTHNEGLMIYEGLINGKMAFMNRKVGIIQSLRLLKEDIGINSDMCLLLPKENKSVEIDYYYEENEIYQEKNSMLKKVGL